MNLQRMLLKTDLYSEYQYLFETFGNKANSATQISDHDLHNYEPGIEGLTSQESLLIKSSNLPYDQELRHIFNLQLRFLEGKEKEDQYGLNKNSNDLL